MHKYCSTSEERVVRGQMSSTRINYFFLVAGVLHFEAIVYFQQISILQEVWTVNRQSALVTIALGAISPEEFTGNSVFSYHFFYWSRHHYHKQELNENEVQKKIHLGIDLE